MTTKVYEKIKKEIKRELLQEFLLPMLKEVQNTEGEYKERFVKDVLRAAKEKPIYLYDPKTFLQQIA